MPASAGRRRVQRGKTQALRRAALRKPRKDQQAVLWFISRLQEKFLYLHCVYTCSHLSGHQINLSGRSKLREMEGSSRRAERATFLLTSRSSRTPCGRPRPAAASASPFQQQRRAPSFFAPALAVSCCGRGLVVARPLSCTLFGVLGTGLARREHASRSRSPLLLFQNPCTKGARLNPLSRHLVREILVVLWRLRGRDGWLCGGCRDGRCVRRRSRSGFSGEKTKKVYLAGCGSLVFRPGTVPEDRRPSSPVPEILSRKFAICAFVRFER